MKGQTEDRHTINIISEIKKKLKLYSFLCTIYHVVPDLQSQAEGESCIFDTSRTQMF